MSHPEQMADTLREKLRDDGWRLQTTRGTQEVYVHPQNTRTVYLPVDNVAMDGRAVHTVYRLTGWGNPPAMAMRDPALRRTPFNPALQVPRVVVDQQASDERKLAAVLYAGDHSVVEAAAKYRVSESQMVAWIEELDPGQLKYAEVEVVAGRRVAGTKVHVQTKHTGEKARVPLVAPTLVVTGDDAPKDVTPQPPPPVAEAKDPANDIARAVMDMRYPTDREACAAFGKGHTYLCYLRKNPGRIPNLKLRDEFIAFMKRRDAYRDNIDVADSIAQAVLSGRYETEALACRAHGKSDSYGQYLRSQPRRIKDPDLRQRFLAKCATENVMPENTASAPSSADALDDVPMFRKQDFVRLDTGEMDKLRAENDRLRRALAEVTMDLYEARRT